MFQMSWFMDQIKRGQRPEQVMMSILESRMKGSPVGDNLINLARQGNGAEIEKVARNLYAQSGKNFDEEFKAFRQYYGL